MTLSKASRLPPSRRNLCMCVCVCEMGDRVPPSLPAHWSPLLSKALLVIPKSQKVELGLLSIRGV